MSKLVLGVSGSIAAYKSADITSALVKAGCDVHVAMTQAATGFITPLTLQALSKNKVYTEVLQEDNPAEIVHVNLPQSADLLLIAPATANIIGKIARGIADDMLTSMVLAAHNIPLLIAPAMNTRMYENPAVVENLGILTKRGWTVIEPQEGRLACGALGKGNLALVDVIVRTTLALIQEAT